MSLADARDAVIGFARERIGLAEPIVFAMGFAEGIPGLSLLVPSSALFIGIGTLHSAAGGSFWHLWLAASLGAVAGDCVVYALGRQYREEVQRLPFFRQRPDWHRRGHDLIERWGALAVLAGKFTSFMRPFIPAVAGILEMPFKIFLPASILSSLAWAGAFLAPGYGILWLLD